MGAFLLMLDVDKSQKRFQSPVKENYLLIKLKGILSIFYGPNYIRKLD